MFSAGEFSAWLDATLEVAHGTGDAVVSCGECNACCRSSLFIRVEPVEIRTLERMPQELLFAAPSSSEMAKVLGYDEHGQCPMLREGACSIYADRPIACRVFDCRVFAATGVVPDRAPIAQRAARWTFEYPTNQGRARQAAVERAAELLARRPECFPDDRPASNALELAMSAILVGDVLLLEDCVDVPSGGLAPEEDASAELIGKVRQRLQAIRDRARKGASRLRAATVPGNGSVEH